MPCLQHLPFLPPAAVKIPEYFQDRFGIYQCEYWSEHFESREPSYLKDLKSAMDKKHCKLINIQVDTPRKDISDPENGKNAASKGITFLSENHFDLLSVPENHVKVAHEVYDENFGLLADFGNYPESTDKYKALELIAPYTRLVSAKTHGFDENYEHTGFDFDRCVRIMEEGGFKGIYSLEQWENGLPDYDFEKIVDWMIGHVKANV